MPKSLFATFPSSDTFSQHFSGEVAAKFLSVLEAVSDCLCHAVDSNRNAINSCILDSLCQCLAGESDEAQFQATGHRLFRFKVDGHPNRGRIKWKKAVEPDCGLQANDAIGYALTREHYLALKVRGEILTGASSGTPNVAFTALVSAMVKAAEEGDASVPISRFLRVANGCMAVSTLLTLGLRL